LRKARKLLVGNQRDGALYSPTCGPRRPEDDLVMQETFGPVSPVIRFRNIDEAIAISNGTAYGRLPRSAPTASTTSTASSRSCTWAR
jgi:acyl-CoA reductase-like NAD-dependent aldehyde dehydrogenase